MNHPAAPRPIKVMADYGCHPLWWDSAHPAWAAFAGAVGEIDPAALGLSPALQAALREWAALYDRSLDPDDPAATPSPAAAFDATGRDLARRLAAELGASATVRYWLDPVPNPPDTP